MKRDMGTIREILLKEEANERTGFSEYEDPAEIYQITLMIDAGLCEGEIIRAGGKPKAAIIYRLTWAGHEFLDTVRDPTVWEKVKTNVIRPGASFTFSMLIEFAKGEAIKRLGVLIP